MIVTLESEEESLELGLKIDSVSEVAYIPFELIDPAPIMAMFSDKLVFSGVARINSGAKLIVDASKLVGQLKDAVTFAFSDQVGRRASSTN